MIGKSKQKRVDLEVKIQNFACWTQLNIWLEILLHRTLINPTAGVFIFREAESPRSEPERNFFLFSAKRSLMHILAIE